MDKQQTINVLVFFRDIEEEIKFCRKVIDQIGEDYYAPRLTSGYDSTPVSGGSSDYASVTEAIALNVPDTTLQTITQMETRIGLLVELKSEIWRELNKLPHKWKAIVYDYYVERDCWERIGRAVGYSVDGCKYIRNKALSRLGGFFVTNRKISQYTYPEL